MTSGGMVLGTIQYMAPEQIKGAHVDRKSDIFAVGYYLFMSCYQDANHLMVIILQRFFITFFMNHIKKWIHRLMSNLLRSDAF